MAKDYNLMHKDIPVALISLDADNGRMVDIKSIITPEHLPLGSVINNIFNSKELKSWWDGRSIPASRDKIEMLLKKLDISDTTALLTKSFGLSLSDCYWVCPDGVDIKWDDVNYYENEFSADIGNIMFGRNSENLTVNESSPDNTSDGNLQKRWKIFNGDRVLVKAGSKPYEQEPFNEVIASRLMDVLGINHVEYDLYLDHNKTYSICPCFTSPKAEFVAASKIYPLQKMRGYESPYTHYINTCENLGVQDAKSNIDKMIFLDYVIANSDRHYNNFGILRNPDTLKPIGVAPIFDSGSSLGYNKRTSVILSETQNESKPFRSTHQEQIKLVKDLSWVKFSNLAKFEDIVRDVFKNNEDVIGESRIEAIITAANKRINELFGGERYHSFKTPYTSEKDTQLNIQVSQNLQNNGCVENTLNTEYDDKNEYDDREYDDYGYDDEYDEDEYDKKSYNRDDDDER